MIVVSLMRQFRMTIENSNAVFPADAGIQKVLKSECRDWTPASAGETNA
jgi:hypothetical protein